MGVGFIIGGFCPGTSLVAAATFKIDGVFFVLGGLFGMFLFGETERFFDQWWNDSYYGRLTIPEWLNLPTGIVVLAIVLMALFMFWGSEQLERIFGGKDPKKQPRLRYAGAAGLVALAVGIILIGQPTMQEKWEMVSDVKEPALENRQIQIQAGELLSLMGDDQLRVVVSDVRPENEYNLFHIEGARSVPLEQLPATIPELHAKQALNTVFVVASNDEAAATDAWKVLSAESIPNAYILEGGVNSWIETFEGEKEGIQPTQAPVADDEIRYSFPAALGSRYESASPDPHEWELEFIPKVQLQLQRDKSGGGCG
jgi:hypothetical protein